MSDTEKLSGRKSVGSCCAFHWRGKVTLLVPILALPILIYGYHKTEPEFKCLYLVLVMAIYWITECIPLFITALLPIVFLPAFGILSSDVCCSYYFTDTLIMFLGGLLIALAVEYSNLNERVALCSILFFGCRPRRLLLGLFIVTGFISLWMPNSATTALMCPIVKAVLIEMQAQNIFNVYKTQEEEPTEDGNPHPSNISLAFYIATSYASSIGGCGTLIGTGTNLTFKGLYETRFPESTETVTFFQMMLYSMPLVVIVNLILVYLCLLFTHMGLCRPNSKIGQEVAKANQSENIARSVIYDRYKALGRISCHEVQVLLLFIMMILLLITYEPGFCDGWAHLLNAKEIGSSMCVMLPVVLLFALPTQYTFVKYCCGKPPFPGRTMDACLSWQFVHTNFPWGFCLLLGGGFALAEGIIVSGMDRMLGESLKFFSVMPKFVVVGCTLVFSLFGTVFGSNVAICNILIPIFCEMALTVEIHPLLLTLPASLAISLAYFLPVSTPPNAIICEYANIKTKYLVKAGIIPTIIAFVVLWVNAMTYGILVFPGSAEFPKWAQDAKEKRYIFNPRKAV